MFCLRCLNFFYVILLFCVPMQMHFLKLNAPRILLPHNNGKPPKFSLELHDYKPNDCFEWNSLSPELVHVHPLFDVSGACPTKAIISVLSQSNIREEAIISISEHGSAVLFCDVIIDGVHGIELEYQTSEIYVGGTPEKLSVIGQNHDGATFSSLDGLKCNWFIEELHKPSNLLDSTIRIVDYLKSSYVAVDENEWQSSYVLVEGQSSGTVKIKVSMETNNGIRETEVMLKVSFVEILSPSGSIYAILGGHVDFTIVSRYGEIRDNSPYNLSLGNSSVARLENNTHLFTLNYGETTLTAKNSDGSFFTSNIHVVEPISMSIDMPHSNNWHLHEAKSYEILVKLWDSMHHEIYPSRNIMIHVVFPSKLFHINSSLTNGLHHYVRALVPGSGVITANFVGIEKNGNMKIHELSTSQKFVIYQALQIFPPVLLLPFYASNSSKYTIPLKVTGGTGSYLWSANDNIAIKIDQKEALSSQATLHIYDKGDFVITVVDKNSSAFTASSKISVQHVSDIEVYPTVVEAEIGNEIFLPAGLLGFECKERKIYRVFDDCSQANITIEIIEKHVVMYKPDTFIPSFGRGCLSLRFICLQPGHSRINLSYKAKNTLKTTLVIACHKPLKPIHPVRVAVLALATSKEIAFEGGARPWPLYTEGHFFQMTANSSGLVNISVIKDPVRYNKDLHIFNVVCKAIGETILTLNVGNKVSPTNPNPAQTKSSIKIVCGQPHSLHIAYKTKDKKTSTLHKSIVKIPFYGNKQFEVDLWIKDDIGRKFGNISSLDIYWDVSDYDVAKPMQHSEVTEHVDGSASYRKISRVFQTFQMTGKPGVLNIKVEILGYNKQILIKEGISTTDEVKKVTTSLDLKLVSLRDLYDEVYSDNEPEKTQEEFCDGEIPANHKEI